jgi:hypothetical protein
MPKNLAKRKGAKAPAVSRPAQSTEDFRAAKPEDFRAAKQELSSRLLKRRDMPMSRALTAAITPDPAWNLQGIGIGEKLVDGRHTGVTAVKFLVRAKYHESHISKKHVLPKTVSGLPTDVEEVGLFRCFDAAPNPRTKIRPAQPGCSVGFADPSGKFVMAGTFGAVVKDSNGIYILSNNHVLADEGQLAPGSPIFQPGLLDGGSPNTDQIAQLTNFVALKPNATNQVDCAIAAVLNPGDVSNAILQIGPPKGVGDAQIDMTVQKFGRTTGYTAGRVTSVDTDVTVQYETGNFTFGEQIIVVGLSEQPFSGAGDSGSLIVERNSNLAVALLFAGSSTHTIANHLGDVLQALNVTLA